MVYTDLLKIVIFTPHSMTIKVQKLFNSTKLSGNMKKSAIKMLPISSTVYFECMVSVYLFLEHYED